MEESFTDQVYKVCKEDRRYPFEAYMFVSNALEYAAYGDKPRHGSGAELLVAGILEYAISEFGAMAWSVFDQWGTRTSDDFGDIVYNLVNRGIWRKTEEGSREDFSGILDFKSAFSDEIDSIYE